MRLLCPLPALLAGLLSLGALAAEPPPLDYTRVIRQSTLVFVPYQGMNQGPIYYTQYEQSPTAVSSAGDLRKITVHLRPTAHIQGQYNGFVSAHGISDARVVPIPSLGTCKPTQEILDLLATMPDRYKPAIQAGSYPNICALVLYFFPTHEQQVRDILQSRPVLTMQASIPMCPGPRLEVPAITRALLALGALQLTPSGDWTGNSWEVLFESTQLALSNPSLFGTTDPRDGWEDYMKLFQLDLVAETATLPAASGQQPISFCTPAPLSIQYGLSTDTTRH